MARPRREVHENMKRLDEISKVYEESADNNDTSNSLTETAPQVSRPKRPPVFAKRNKLTVPNLNLNEFHYHWFADREGNIEARLEEGYVFVKKDGQEAGDRDANYSQSKSSLLTRPGGFGATLYLMRIPLDEWIARQEAASQKDASDREVYIKEKVKTVKGLTGNLKVSFR